ncbi:tRNA 5-hydroxyuridine modification protein YegQ [Neptunicella marina]|uniref:tRNA 5-hydroxyuridine modification protein YegQ n=1 Tax=Neptunicella marina TaxID=2125989 RepID=A0A8J6ISM5_9ALTE|nr:tRNA 5-hydroxyuridine modification protein YegQ [Neptunicella marina]MBC3765554.1 tRNA 5-hydroxyuridine modification protein YegQ [Neptunicella marina]
MKSPELLSPAGSLKNMRYAFAYGADAVYAGQPRYSLRVRNNEFDHDNLALAINEAHQLGKQFYVVNNIAPHNGKLKTFLNDLAPVVAMQPDAFIMSDPGLIMLAKDAYPDLNIHLSVQANAVNWASVKFWQRQGISRVILSRELSIEEIEEIRQQCPDMELEVFVHGALCMAYSGRCLLSGYINKRDPNQGTCTNACRWQYQINSAEQDEMGNLQPGDVLATGNYAGGCGEQSASPLFVMQESGRPGELMPAFEDEHGTYIFNSRDLRAVQHVERLLKIGVDSLKIEGRTKSFYYCARTAQIYRQAMDDALAGKTFNPSLMHELEHLANRGYTDGFLKRHKQHGDLQNYDYASSVSDTQQLVGEVIEKQNNRYLVEVKNKFVVGDTLELISPAGNHSWTITQMWDKQGNVITDAKGSGHHVWLELPVEVKPEFCIVVRHLPHSQTTRSQFVSQIPLATQVD